MQAAAPIAENVRRCAHAVEAAFTAARVRLTMGGEPTFVPLQPAGAEWSGAALGPTKLSYARRFADALLATTLPGGVVIETPGKLYPGEDLPRWALQVHARTDGAPLWRNRALLRGDDTPGGSATVGCALALARALAGRLGLDPSHVLPVDERAGPTEVPVPRGCVLPLDDRDGTWISDHWVYPAGRVTVDEPGRWLGLRLPLGALPAGALRRALTVEARDGQLAVFVPPLLFEAYARLLAAIEDAVAAIDPGPLILAGYAPPAAPGFLALGLTPDPGVIEANLPPCATWEAYQSWLDALYRAADRVGLCARKLHFNGRTTGTGGGAHVCFGGPTPLESPFFARPDLIPSILHYWQRHPVLSYAFTGQYIGPTSQAPRPDETLPDRLGELALACEGAPEVCRPDALLQFDRLFRHLLADGGGNTHRTEISVDKLWNPLMPNGCLGLLEWRAFETQPTARALGHVGLLLRAILARLLARPCAEPFIDWGASLRDRFLLPSFLWLDLGAIIDDVRACGLPFDAAWLAEAWAFRFPCLGTLDTPHGTIEMRQALEVWPVLSEQDNGAITSRVVDSSLDRVEFRLADPAAAGRGRLLVNGRPLTLRREGEVCAAGVRFRAFTLPTSFHPHIPAHAPLSIEWADAVTGVVLAAARWHSWHPDGEAYPGLPADEAEAAARMVARWVRDDATRGARRAIPVADPGQAAHEYTLDLRRRCPPAWQASTPTTAGRP
ncbi:MAG: transglutaminase family protein [Opitutaceae bacterium]|nr:transglutaminase family protein [Opitutaceae bacterium]